MAEIGASDWFAEMLNNRARVIWIDTPATRSLIKRRFKRDFSVNSSEEDNYVEIGDFRDTVFPIIFTLAKRNVDASMIQQRKHFIVRWAYTLQQTLIRFGNKLLMVRSLCKLNIMIALIYSCSLKGFDNFENEEDPFVDLSSHKRYLIPRDLSSLCSDL